MRTTLDIADDVLSAARDLARERGESIGSVVSALARAGLRPRSVEVIDGLPIIRAESGEPLITDSMVRETLDDE